MILRSAARPFYDKSFVHGRLTIKFPTALMLNAAITFDFFSKIFFIMKNFVITWYELIWEKVLLKGGRSAQYIKYKFFIFYNLIQEHSDKKTQPNITSEYDIFFNIAQSRCVM